MAPNMCGCACVCASTCVSEVSRESKRKGSGWWHSTVIHPGALAAPCALAGNRPWVKDNRLHPGIELAAGLFVVDHRKAVLLLRLKPFHCKEKPLVVTCVCVWGGGGGVVGFEPAKPESVRRVSSFPFSRGARARVCVCGQRMPHLSC